MKRNLKLIMSLLSLLLLSNIALGTPVKGTASFVSTANPGLLTIEGEGGVLTGNLEVVEGKVVGTLDVALKDLDTDNSLRNKHMREKYLEVKKFPKATLKLEPTQIKPKGDFKGWLTIKGQTKPVIGSYEFNNGDVGATMSFDVKDFPAIGIPSYLGITVSDFVVVTARFAFKG